MKDIFEELRNTKKYKAIFGAGKLGRDWGYSFFMELGIRIDFYCDNNTALWGEFINGIKTISPDALSTLKDNVIVIIAVRFDRVNSVRSQLEEMGIASIVEYYDILNLQETKRKYFPFMEYRIAIYTCVTNQYDPIPHYKSLMKNCDYYLISDEEPTDSDSKYIHINDAVPKSIKNPICQNRYCKMNAHLLFPDYRYSIYADANLFFSKDCSVFVNMLPKTRLAVLARWSDDIYAHGIRFINSGKGDREILLRQLQQYWIEGMPENYGVFMCGALVREHNNPVCKKIMEEWWEEFNKYPGRDQISLPYVLWKNGYSFDDVGIIEKGYSIRGPLEFEYFDYNNYHSK